MSDTVSILVITRDRRGMLNRLLNDLHKQRFRGEVEVVVVEETDDPVPPPGVRYVPHPMRNKGIAFARNLSIEHADHDLLVFIDVDCRVDADWLERLIAPMNDQSIMGVRGGVTVPEGTGPIGWAETLLGFPGGDISRIQQSGGEIQEILEVSTLNAAYRKQAVLDAGGFDSDARFGGEDYVLAKRVAKQGKLLFVPSALVRHTARENLSSIWGWFVRRGMAEVGLLRSGAGPDGYASFILRSSLGLKLVFSALLGWWNWWPLLLFVLLVVGRTAWRTRWALGRRGVPIAAWFFAPLVKMNMDIAADAGRLMADVSLFSDMVGGGQCAMK